MPGNDKSVMILEARKAVEAHTNDHIVTPVLGIFQDIYASSQRRDPRLAYFQKQLKAVPNWTSLTLAEKCSPILQSCDFLPELVSALFLSHIRILASIKVSKLARVKVKIPKSEKFLHAVMIETAKAFYETPQAFRSETVEVRRRMVAGAIDAVIRKMLPVKDILTAYLGNQAKIKRTAAAEEDDEMETPLRDEEDEDDGEDEELDDTEVQEDDVGKEEEDDEPEDPEAEGEPPSVKAPASAVSTASIRTNKHERVVTSASAATTESHHYPEKAMDEVMRPPPPPSPPAPAPRADGKRRKRQDEPIDPKARLAMTFFDDANE